MNNFDYYAFLSKENKCSNMKSGYLASGFVDACTASFFKSDDDREKNNTREKYIKKAKKARQYRLPTKFNFNPDFSKLPDSSWFGIEVEFKLLSPWYSKDDRVFHVMDNPVRKDRVFGVPFMSSSSWKGQLRWACRMEEGLLDHLREHNMKMDAWEEPEWIVHLFGNELTEDENSTHIRGALVFYPTWFDSVGFEVINPHKRSTRAGSHPIYYEVVPAETEGKLQMLYLSKLGKVKGEKFSDVGYVLSKLIKATNTLLEIYGISAKRTSGWGSVKVDAVGMYFVDGSLFQGGTAHNSEVEYSRPDGKFKNLLDEEGTPIQVLLDDKGGLISQTQFKKLGDEKPNCTKNEYSSFSEWYKRCGERYRNEVAGIRNTSLPETVKLAFSSLAELITMLEDTQRGGV
jgi:CRISPR-associated protein Cmr2